MKKRIFCIFVGVMLLLTQISFAQEPIVPQQDENGYYQIGTVEELFWFADFVKTTAEAEFNATETGEKVTRTLVKGKLTADINLNPNMSVFYDEETGKVTLTNGDISYKMGTGLKDTTIGKFEDLSGEEVLSEDVETALQIVKWIPIGTSKLPFVGYFDGNGHKVDGLYINEHKPRDDDEYLNNDVGFFGNTNTADTTENYEDYKIQNFSVGQNSLVVGYDETKLENNMTSSQCVGAIVGNLCRDSLYKCENNAIVVGMGSDVLSSMVGGLVGLAVGAIDECTNKGTVISPNAAGGIVGWKRIYDRSNYFYETHTKIYKCINFGKVLSNTKNMYSLAGGIIAVAGGSYEFEGGYIDGCCNNGYVSGGEAGGIVASTRNNTKILCCANFGSINASYVAGGIIGYTQFSNSRVSAQLCYNAGKINYIADIPDITDTTDTYIYPLVGFCNSDDTGSKVCWLQNSYNNSDICPATDKTLASEKVTPDNCHSVPTSAFKSGEVAFKMEENDKTISSNSGWKQNLEYPKEEGKIIDDYPSVFGEKSVYKTIYNCCHNENDEEYTLHKKEIYANTSDEITAPHSFGEDKVCTHCGAYGGKPEFLSENTKLKNGKVGNEYYVTVRLSERSTNNGPNWNSPKYTVLEKQTLPKGIEVIGYENNLDINGIPEESGNYSFTVQVENNYGTTEKTFTLTVKKADKLEIYTKKFPNVSVGKDCCLDLTANISGVKWSIVDESKLPEGLAIGKYNEISGTPALGTEGKYTFTVKAESYGQTATKEFTLTVDPEGGCQHTGKILVPEVAPTCQANGTLAYYYCEDCDCRFRDEACKEELYAYNFPKSIETASNHIDNNSDNKCDFCGKAMPLFMQVTSNSLITTEGTYAFVSKIGDKYYALSVPTDGTEYSDKTTMPVCEVNIENGVFTFNELKNKGAIMVKTGFCVADGNLDAGEPRYSLSTIIGKFIYGLNGDYGSSKTPVFTLNNSYSDSKYGWHLSIDNNKNVNISSVYHEIWGEDNTKEMLKAYITEDTSYMSLCDTTDNTPYDVQLYKMIDIGNADDKNYIITDNKGNYKSNDTAFTVDNAGLSNVSGISNSVTESYIAQTIDDVSDTSNSLCVESYADIQLNEAELLYENTYDGIKYSLTPRIKITDGNGDVISDLEISDDVLNGNKMTVTLSVGGSDPKQIIHYKNDGMKEYFYSEYSNEVMYKGEKSFKLMYNEKGNFVSFELTSFSVIEILESVKIEDDEDDVTNKNAISYENSTLKITVEKAGKYSVIFANYSGNQMTGFKELAIELNEGINDVTIPQDVVLSVGSKIFLWNTLSDLVPLCKEKTIE